MRHPNHRLVKINRTYDVGEAARMLRVHKNTVRQWIKQGLATVDSRRPTLLRGSDLVDFLAKRRSANKRPCRLGEMYCLRCRAPKTPANGTVVLQRLGGTRGNLGGQCPTCGLRLNRRVNLAGAAAIQAKSTTSVPQPQSRLDGCVRPSVNSDFGPEGATNANTQPR